MKRYRDHRPHDRFVSLALALAACIGLVGVVGVKSINDKNEQQKREADWKAFQQSLLDEKKRLDNYRAELVALADQLNAQYRRQQKAAKNLAKAAKSNTSSKTTNSQPAPQPQAAPKPKPAPQAVTRSS